MVNCQFATPRGAAFPVGTWEHEFALFLSFLGQQHNNLVQRNPTSSQISHLTSPYRFIFSPTATNINQFSAQIKSSILRFSRCSFSSSRFTFQPIGRLAGNQGLLAIEFFRRKVLSCWRLLVSGVGNCFGG